MSSDKIYKGVWPTMITPFNDDLSIDYDGVAALVDWYVSCGVDGIFALCQSSEMFFLTLEESASLVRFVLKRVAGRVPVVISGHVAEDPQKQRADLIALAGEGADAVILITNRFGRAEEGDGAWIERFERLAGALPARMRLGFYECPYPEPRLVSAEMMKRIVADGRFVFFKDTSCSLEAVRERIDIAKQSRVSILNANTAFLLRTLEFGADGYCGVMANMHPRLYSYLCANFGDPELRGDVLRLSDYLSVFSAIEARAYPVCAKYYLSRLGLPVKINTRSKDASQLTASFREEMDCLLRVSREWERALRAT